MRLPASALQLRHELLGLGARGSVADHNRRALRPEASRDSSTERASAPGDHRHPPLEAASVIPLITHASPVARGALTIARRVSRGFARFPWSDLVAFRPERHRASCSTLWPLIRLPRPDDFRKVAASVAKFSVAKRLFEFTGYSSVTRQIVFGVVPLLALERDHNPFGFVVHVDALDPATIAAAKVHRGCEPAIRWTRSATGHIEGQLRRLTENQHGGDDRGDCYAETEETDQHGPIINDAGCRPKRYFRSEKTVTGISNWRSSLSSNPCSCQPSRSGARSPTTM